MAVGQIYNKYFSNTSDGLKLPDFMNGLNPIIFEEWCDLMNLCSDDNSKCEITNWLREFELSPSKWSKVYAFNVYFHCYEYIDCTVKFKLPTN